MERRVTSDAAGVIPDLDVAELPATTPLPRPSHRFGCSLSASRKHGRLSRGAEIQVERLRSDPQPRPSQQRSTSRICGSAPISGTKLHSSESCEHTTETFQGSGATVKKLGRSTGPACKVASSEVDEEASAGLRGQPVAEACFLFRTIPPLGGRRRSSVSWHSLSTSYTQGAHAPACCAERAEWQILSAHPTRAHGSLGCDLTKTRIGATLRRFRSSRWLFIYSSAEINDRLAAPVEGDAADRAALDAGRN
jgi:hypothetical protein